MYLSVVLGYGHHGAGAGRRHVEPVDGRLGLDVGGGRAHVPQVPDFDLAEHGASHRISVSLR